MKSGNLNFLEPSGPLQACNGTDLPDPITGLDRPLGLREVEACGISRQTAHESGKVSPMHQPPLHIIEFEHIFLCDVLFIKRMK